MKLEELRNPFGDGSLLLSDEVLEKFHQYAVLLKEWNEKINLTSIVEEEEVYVKHIYDSLLPAKQYDLSKGNLIDMGTGAGFPGMVLAILFPNLKVTLADSTQKKFAFLNEVKEQLGLKNVSFHAGRIEEMRTFREHFTFVTARGFSALQNVLELGMPLLKKGGILIAYKGDKGKEELKESERALKILGGQLMFLQNEDLPEDGGKRINLFVKKIAQTPKRYPREWAEIVKRPL